MWDLSSPARIKPTSQLERWILNHGPSAKSHHLILWPSFDLVPMCQDALPGVCVIPGHSLEPQDALDSHCTEMGTQAPGRENQTPWSHAREDMGEDEGQGLWLHTDLDQDTFLPLAGRVVFDKSIDLPVTCKQKR